MTFEKLPEASGIVHEEGGKLGFLSPLVEGCRLGC